MENVNYLNMFNMLKVLEVGGMEEENVYYIVLNMLVVQFYYYYLVYFVLCLVFVLLIFSGLGLCYLYYLV